MIRALVVHPRFRCFAPVFLEKRLDLKSLKRQTKAEELGTPGFKLLSPRLEHEREFCGKAFERESSRHQH